ncbi:MAG: asparagine synthase [Nitrososphaerota archaeon]|nr:asparagine synthase [Nitrososphaerota archaeon]
MEGENVVAVAFSGGLDSSILARCAKPRARVVACTGYAPGSLDSQRSEQAASQLGVELARAELTSERVVGELANVALPFEPTLMDRSLWCLYSLVSQKANGAGAKVILLGQLADELFGGYQKYAEAARSGGPGAAEQMMSQDFRDYAAKGKLRDEGACSRWVEPRLPYGDAEVVDFANSIPLSFKIAAGVRKAVLRRAATLLGVPEGVANAPKKAAQYSSGVQKLVAGSRF